jgi:hypothetical protein
MGRGPNRLVALLGQSGYDDDIDTVPADIRSRLAEVP